MPLRNGKEYRKKEYRKKEYLKKFFPKETRPFNMILFLDYIRKISRCIREFLAKVSV